MIESSQAPLEKLINSILIEAVKCDAKEIHIRRQVTDSPVKNEIRGLSTTLSFTSKEDGYVSFRGSEDFKKQLDLPHFIMAPLSNHIQDLSAAKMSKQHGFVEGLLHFECALQSYDWQVLVGPDEWIVLKQVSPLLSQDDGTLNPN